MDHLKRHDVPEVVDEKQWMLDLHGEVEQRIRLDQDDLMEFPAETYSDKFACVEGWVTERISWRGIRLSEILSRTKITADGQYAIVRAMDSEYACAFPLQRLRDSLLAVELNGEALPREHGGPARLVPMDFESDCWESIKWVSEIEITPRVEPAEDTAKEIALGRLG